MTISNQPAVRSRRVLVVDDEYSIIELLQNLLEDEGYEVVTASNGREGLAQLARHPVDLVLCDIMMPFMNGLQLCQAMKDAESAFRHTPLVFMSAAGPPPPVTAVITPRLSISPLTWTIYLNLLPASPSLPVKSPIFWPVRKGTKTGG